MIKVAILGIGRMGKEVLRQCVSEGFEVVAVISRKDSTKLGMDAGRLSGISPLNVSVSSSENLAEILEETKPDVVIDFTNADACIENSKVVCEKKINMVIGTTGFSESQLDELRGCIEKNEIGAVISPNMSIGVNVFWKLIKEAAKLLKGYEIEIVEAHHRFKKDKPSGTAIKTAKIISREIGRDWGEIPIHSLRVGDIVGEHTVLFATIGERLEITHKAHSRDAFSRGVIKAVKFIQGKKGLYNMDDVIGLNKKSRTE